MLISDFSPLAGCSRCAPVTAPLNLRRNVQRGPSAGVQSVIGSKLPCTACSPIARKPRKRRNNVAYPKHRTFEHPSWFTTSKTCACLKFQQPVLCEVTPGHVFPATNQNQNYFCPLVHSKSGRGLNPELLFFFLYFKTQ